MISKFNFFKPIIFVRLYGGLGNQLFTYAAAYRFAKLNRCDLIIDTKTGFIRDFKYKRKYLLNSFSITANKIETYDFISYIISYLIPVIKKIDQRLPFPKRLIIHDGIGFNEKFLNLYINSAKVFDGFWQSEKYFKDVEVEIRREFTFSKITFDALSIIKTEICFNKSVAIHIRHFNDDRHINQGNIDDHYYERAIDFFCNRFQDVKFWLFTDNPILAKHRLFANISNCIIVSDKFYNLTDIDELYLMSQFSNFIISNSTYSWWGAWLSNKVDKIVVAPSDKIDSAEGLWGFEGLLPDEWIKL